MSTKELIKKLHSIASLTGLSTRQSINNLIQEIEEEQEKERYFLVMYASTDPNGTAIGDFCIKNTHYPNQKILTNYMKNEYHLTTFNITNIIELKTKEDYESFTKN